MTDKCNRSGMSATPDFLTELRRRASAALDDERLQALFIGDMILEIEKRFPGTIERINREYPWLAKPTTQAAEIFKFEKMLEMIDRDAAASLKSLDMINAP
jgi:hypothetical protein